MENSLVNEYLAREGLMTISRYEAEILWQNLKNHWLSRDHDHKAAKALMDKLYQHSQTK